MRHALRAASLAAALLSPGLAAAQQAPALVLPTPQDQEAAPSPSVTLADGITLGGYFDTEFNFEHFGRRGSIPSWNSIANETEFGLYLNLPRGFAVNAVFRYEGAEREADGSNRAFYASTAFVDRLYISWTEGPLQIFGGKIHPRFGFAWDRAPGLYGPDFAEGYELVEKLGAGVQLTWSDLIGRTAEIGTHTLQVEFFQADNTGLSSSIGARRYPWTQTFTDPATGESFSRTSYRATNRRWLGGPDNTEGFGNYVVSLGGTGVPLGFANLDYTLGAMSRSTNASDTPGSGQTERGYVAGVALEIELPQRLTLTPLVEVLRLNDAQGIAGVTRDTLTAGFELARRPFAASYAYQAEREHGAASSWAAAHTATLSYDLADLAGWLDGFTVNLGWRNLRQGGVSANDYGAQITYGIRF